jgi:FAD/FMN-containing dehydrogenase
MGRSYGDSCLNEGGALLDMRGLDRFIALDAEAGLLEAEAGLTFAAILGRLTEIAAPGRTWFLPVSPGTKFVTLGGAIANDVHGKNHHSAGCLGNHIVSLRLLRSDGTVVLCAPDRNAALFAATIGGLGLTGVILSAVLRLKPVASMWLETEEIRMDHLADFASLSDASENSWDYTVAWIDCLARGAALGRGIFTRARHARHPGPPPPPVSTPKRRLPIELPAGLLSAASIGAFNALYRARAPRTPRRRTLSYEPVFYPLDAVAHWNRMYGRPGFHQYQCVIPRAGAADAIPALLRTIADARQGSFLAVLKTFGDRVSPGMLSFPRPGTTLALDFPNQGPATTDLLDRLDAITTDAGGRVYPAKDGRLSPAHFQHAYPMWRDFAQHVDPNLSSSFWRRVSAQAPTEAFCGTS